MKYPLLPFSPNHIQFYAQPAPCPSLSVPHHLRRSLAPNAPPVHITSVIPNTRNTIRVLHAFFTSSYRSDAHLPGGNPTLVPNTLLPISAHSPSPHHSIPFSTHVHEGFFLWLVFKFFLFFFVLFLIFLFFVLFFFVFFVFLGGDGR